MRPAHHIALALALVLAVAGCGRSFHVTAVKPTGGAGSAIESALVAAVQFDIDRRIDGKKRDILEQNQAPTKMATALMQSFQSIGAAAPGGEGLTLTCIIQEFRLSRWGGAHMQVTATITDAAGAEVRTFTVNSTSSRASLTVVAQDIIRKIASGV